MLQIIVESHGRYSNSLLIQAPVASLYSAPSFSAELINQAVMWEQVEIVDVSGNWYQVRQEDNYSGWLHKFYTRAGKNPEEMPKVLISDHFGKIYTDPAENAQLLARAVFGTRLPETGKERGWHHVRLPGGDAGWLEPQHQRERFSRRNLLRTAEKLIGVPYLWGGRTVYGFDCSGFVQTVFKYWGLDIPRDSGEQFVTTQLECIEFHRCAPGDLIFFRRKAGIVHVGISTGTGCVVHCQGMVRTDPLFMNGELPETLRDTEPVAMSVEKLVQAQHGVDSGKIGINDGGN